MGKIGTPWPPRVFQVFAPDDMALPREAREFREAVEGVCDGLPGENQTFIHISYDVLHI